VPALWGRAALAYNPPKKMYTGYCYVKSWVLKDSCLCCSAKALAFCGIHRFSQRPLLRLSKISPFILSPDHWFQWFLLFTCTKIVRRGILPKKSWVIIYVKQLQSFGRHSSSSIFMFPFWYFTHEKKLIVLCNHLTCDWLLCNGVKPFFANIIETND